MSSSYHRHSVILYTPPPKKKTTKKQEISPSHRDYTSPQLPIAPVLAIRLPVPTEPPAPTSQ